MEFDKGDAAARYAAAVFLPAVALLLTLVFGPALQYTPSVFMFAAVVISAWFGGFGPAALTAALGAVALEFFVMPPEFGWAGAESLSRVGAFVALGLLMGWLGNQRQPRHQPADALADIVDSCTDAIFGESLDGTIVAWNPAAERLYGYTAGEMRGIPALVLYPAELAARVTAERQQAVRGDPVKPFAVTQIRKDGQRLEVLLTISPIRTRGGAVSGTSIIARPFVAEARETDQPQPTA
jgi:PAS domain S-box-containing protein